MSTALERLERRRNALYQRLQALGDFRPGTISVNFRKCGKKRCACARPTHPGHGPQYLWNTTSGGQSRARSEEHTSELQSRLHLVCRLLLEKKNSQGTDVAHTTRTARTITTPHTVHLHCPGKAQTL